jgi:hypothetical protein
MIDWGAKLDECLARLSNLAPHADLGGEMQPPPPGREEFFAAYRRAKADAIAAAKEYANHEEAP